MSTQNISLTEKRMLLAGEGEIAEKIRAIPEIALEEIAENPERGIISLHALFERASIDRWHVDSMVLKKIALSVLRVLTALADAGIRAGLYDLADIVTDLNRDTKPVRFLRPERFQLADYEQDYEWFPEDERLLPGMTHFDASSQLIADNRLIYKILVGSARGNVRVPPRKSDLDYATLFYNVLPDEWKTAFEGGKVFSREELKELLSASVALEEEYARRSRQRIERMEKEGAVLPPVYGQEEEADEDGQVRLVWYVLLRTQPARSGDMGKMLYDLQEQTEQACLMKKNRLLQGFVYGDGMVLARQIREYPAGYRSQLAARIREYSAGEALIIAADLVAENLEAMSDGEEEYTTVTVCFLADGQIPNDRLFRAGAARIRSLAERGVRIRFIKPAAAVTCEAFDTLTEMEKGSVAEGGGSHATEEAAGLS